MLSLSNYCHGVSHNEAYYAIGNEYGMWNVTYVTR